MVSERCQRSMWQVVARVPWPALAAICLYLPGIVLWCVFALRSKASTFLFLNTVAAVSEDTVNGVTNTVNTTLITLAAGGTFIFGLALVLAIARSVQQAGLAPQACCPCARPTPSSYYLFRVFNLGFSLIIFFLNMAIILLMMGAFLWLVVAYAANVSIKFGVRGAEASGMDPAEQFNRAARNYSTVVSTYRQQLTQTPPCVVNTTWFKGLNQSIASILTPPSDTNSTNVTNTLLCPQSCLNLGSFATLFKLSQNCICSQEQLFLLQEYSATVSTEAGVALGGSILIYFAICFLHTYLTSQYVHAGYDYRAAKQQYAEHLKQRRRQLAGGSSSSSQRNNYNGPPNGPANGPAEFIEGPDGTIFARDPGLQVGVAANGYMPGHAAAGIAAVAAAHGSLDEEKGNGFARHSVNGPLQHTDRHRGLQDPAVLQRLANGTPVRMHSYGHLIGPAGSSSNSSSVIGQSNSMLAGSSVTDSMAAVNGAAATASGGLGDAFGGHSRHSSGGSGALPPMPMPAALDPTSGLSRAATGPLLAAAPAAMAVASQWPSAGQNGSSQQVVAVPPGGLAAAAERRAETVVQQQQQQRPSSQHGRSASHSSAGSTQQVPYHGNAANKWPDLNSDDAQHVSNAGQNSAYSGIGKRPPQHKPSSSGGSNESIIYHSPRSSDGGSISSGLSIAAAAARHVLDLSPAGIARIQQQQQQGTGAGRYESLQSCKSSSVRGRSWPVGPAQGSSIAAVSADPLNALLAVAADEARTLPATAAVAAAAADIAASGPAVQELCNLPESIDQSTVDSVGPNRQWLHRRLPAFDLSRTSPSLWFTIESLEERQQHGRGQQLQQLDMNTQQQQQQWQQQQMQPGRQQAEQQNVVQQQQEEAQHMQQQQVQQHSRQHVDQEHEQQAHSHHLQQHQQDHVADSVTCRTEGTAGMADANAVGSVSSNIAPAISEFIGTATAVTMAAARKGLAVRRVLLPPAPLQVTDNTHELLPSGPVAHQQQLMLLQQQQEAVGGAASLLPSPPAPAALSASEETTLQQEWQQEQQDEQQHSSLTSLLLPPEQRQLLLRHQQQQLALLLHQQQHEQHDEEQQHKQLLLPQHYRHHSTPTPLTPPAPPTAGVAPTGVSVVGCYRQLHHNMQSSPAVRLHIQLPSADSFSNVSSAAGSRVGRFATNSSSLAVQPMASGGWKASSSSNHNLDAGATGIPSSPRNIGNLYNNMYSNPQSSPALYQTPVGIPVQPPGTCASSLVNIMPLSTAGVVNTGASTGGMAPPSPGTSGLSSIGHNLSGGTSLQAVTSTPSTGFAAGSLDEVTSYGGAVTPHDQVLGRCGTSCNSAACNGNGSSSSSGGCPVTPTGSGGSSTAAAGFAAGPGPSSSRSSPGSPSAAQPGSSSGLCLSGRPRSALGGLGSLPPTIPEASGYCSDEGEDAFGRLSVAGPGRGCDVALGSPLERRRTGYRNSMRKGLMAYDQYKHRQRYQQEVSSPLDPRTELSRRYRNRVPAV